MPEDLGVPSQTAANGKEQTWRLNFELPDTGSVELPDIGEVQITAYRRVVLRDENDDIVGLVDNPEIVEFLFPGSKYKKERSITLVELEAKNPGLAASLQSTINTIIMDQKATE